MGVFYDHTDSTYIVSALSEEIKATVTDSGDMEWCPHGFHGTYGENPVSLLQLCVGRRCLVFQLIHCNYIPDKLNDFLLDERFLFVGVGIGDDLMKLEHEYGLGVMNSYDLRDFAAWKLDRQEMRQWGLKSLVMEVMGVHMEKLRWVRISNWARRVLFEEQIEYAVLDAFASFEVFRRLYDRYF